MKFLFPVLLFCILSHGGVKTEFKGRPVFQTTEVGVNSGTFKKLDEKEADGYQCLISEIDGKYYWASRENKEVIRIPGGMYIIYVSVEGAGFVKVINPAIKSSPEWGKIVQLLTDTEKKFDYVEVLHTGLKTINYFGIAN